MPAGPPTMSVGLLGVVPVRAADRLASAFLLGEPLFAHAARALERSGACSRVVVATDGVPSVRQATNDAHVKTAVVGEADVLALLESAAGGQVVLHDPRCPTASMADVQAVVSVGGVAPRVGARAVTDTIKSVSADRSRVTGTVDRATYQQICSPLVAPAAMLARLVSEQPAGWLLEPLPTVVRALGALAPVTIVPVSAGALRVHDLDELAVLRARGVAEV